MRLSGYDSSARDQQIMQDKGTPNSLSRMAVIRSSFLVLRRKQHYPILEIQFHLL